MQHEKEKIKLWLINFAEILDASQNKGSAIKREDTHKRQRPTKLLLTLGGKNKWLTIL